MICCCINQIACIGLKGAPDLSSLLSEIVELVITPFVGFTLQNAQVGGHLKGVCRKWPQLIYNYKGGSSCDALIPSGYETPSAVPSPVSPVGSIETIINPPTFDPIFDF